MKVWVVKFYKSKAWQQCRAGYLTSVYGLCERCGAPAKIVHHKIELTLENINDPEVALNWNNLEAVCQD
jgi:5-methylcytosine-specific restriction endonuclease McrA